MCTHETVTDEVGRRGTGTIVKASDDGGGRDWQGESVCGGGRGTGINQGQKMRKWLKLAQRERAKMSVSRSRWWVGEWAELPVVEGGWGPHYIDGGKGEAARRTSMQVAEKADFDSKGC
jgi:hypothetical protein